MMVAEFMGRNQSGSPVNGELPHITSNMPGSHCRDGMLSNTNSPSPDSYQGSYSPMSPHPHNGGEGKASSNGSSGSTKGELLPQRKQREFTPDNKKDDSYWDRRRRNNEAAKRSREKRRFNDMILEQRVLELTKENTILKAQLETIKEEFGICGESVVNVEKVLATLPTNEQMLSVTKRQKISHGGNQYFGGGAPHSPIPTPVIQSAIGLPGSPSPPPPSMPAASAHSVSGLQHQHQHQQQHSPPAILHDPAYRDMVDYPHHPYAGHSHNHTTYHTIHPHHPQHLPQHLPHHHPYGLHHPTASTLSHHNDDDDGDNALNLTSRASRVSRARQSTQSPTTYEVSSNSGDESSPLAPLALTTNGNVHTQHNSNNNNNNNNNSEANNSLPLKLRHKQHPLGDKDAANTLLSLQHIKQEPGNSSRCSPPYDGEGSSDERDSGISLGSECPSVHLQPSIIPDLPPNAIRIRNEMRLEHQSVAYIRSMAYHRTKQHAKETPA